MSRKSIFELIKSNNTMQKDAERLIELFHERESIRFGTDIYTIEDFVDGYCFRDWPNRSRCLDVEDYLCTLGIEEIDRFIPKSQDEFLLLIEIIYNFWYISGNYNNEELMTAFGFEYLPEYNQLKNMMDECLPEYNQKAYYNAETQQCLIIEDSPQVTATAEVSESETAIEIIRYNHRSLKGDIQKKKMILKALGDSLEGRKKDITQINNTLYKTITGALNNLNIRHNNSNPKNTSNYHRIVAEMTDEELETHYDDLYQLILLAILLVDNVARQQEIQELTQRVTKKE